VAVAAPRSTSIAAIASTRARTSRVASALAAAVLGGCGSGSGSDSGATSAPAAPARPELSAGSANTSSCENLRVSSDVRSALQRTHEQLRSRSGVTHDDGPIAKGSLYYGRCGSTHYAIASFSKAIADQPEKFRMPAGRPWVDEGDGFESGCGDARKPIPRALVRLWRLCPTDGLPESPTPQDPGKSAPESASASAGRCMAGALRAVSSGGQGAAGTQFASLRFELRGAGRCTLRGFPGVTLLDAGRRLSTDVRRFSAGRMRPVVIDARHPAHFDLSYRVTGQSERPCRTRVTDLRIIPPDDRIALAVRLRPKPLTLCLESVRVGAVRATSALAGS